MVFISKGRLNFFFISVMILFGCVFIRLFYLHIWKQEKLIDVVERTRQKFDILHARRGNIVDKRGNLLATTHSVIELGIDPQAYREEDRIKWKQLAKLTGIPLKVITQAFTEKFKKVKDTGGVEEVRQIRWHKLIGNLDEAIYEKVMALEIKGVYGNRKYERVYPHKSLAAHVLGFVNKECNAVDGVERFMNFYLNGQDGWIESEKDGRRRELAQFRTREIKPVDGLNVELTIDLMVQHEIEEQVAQIVQECNPKSVSILVSEPSTGFILGLANYPFFDPNEFWKYDIDSHRNRAVTDCYEPGSPVKAMTMSAVLNESLLNFDKIYDCSIDRIEYQGRIVKLPKDHRPFDKLSTKDVLKKSSNRGIAQIAMQLDNQKYYEYIRSFGFGEKTGYGPGAEVIGTVHPVKNWDGLTISRMPMGHAINGTIMQTHYAMSVFANQGILMQPQIVKRIFDEKGNTIIDFMPRAKRRVVSVDTAETIAKLLSEVVGPEGTSSRAFINDYNVGGKSGTSQKIIKGRYSNKHHVGSFSGFFPVDNPRLMITIVIDEPKIGKVGYGGIVAAPAFRKIGENLIQHLNIKPSSLDDNLIAYKFQ